VNSQLFNISDPRPVHFVGIAGAGMSALAELFHRRGVPVSGCDANAANVEDLAALGVAVAGQHDPSHVDGARALVVTSAMPKGHPELERARQLGIPVIRRAEALGEAVNAGRLVAVAGTHGKTTTTVLTTEALAAAALDPTGVVGARVRGWGGNLRRGGDDVFVVEADEYDRSFLALVPTVAIVTNLEADHLDIYADLEDIQGAFSTFVAPARWIIACADDPHATRLPYPVSAEVIRYGVADAVGGVAPDARLVARDVAPWGTGSRFRVTFDYKDVGTFELPLPGLHNVRNALAAIGAGLALGADPTQLAAGLRGVEGAERRFQRIGESRGVLVVDDYAHHPTEVAATIAAARQALPGRRLVVAFQPHLFSRTRDFAAEFGAALAEADVCFLCDIYPAREQPMPGVTSAMIAAPMAAAGRSPVWQGSRAAVALALAAAVAPGDVVVTMGAGDITKAARELLAALEGRA
jgi:UDP-N-acetylmuramate--alanine ligase